MNPYLFLYYAIPVHFVSCSPMEIKIVRRIRSLFDVAYRT